VAVLTVFSSYWNETVITNLPSDVKFVSASYDQSIRNPQVVVGPTDSEDAKWESGKDLYFRPILAIHVYVRVPEGNLSNTAMGVLKQQRTAMINNVRTIVQKHPDRPVSDIMFLFPYGRRRDLDLYKEARPVILHSVIQVQAWFVESYP
jgi:hypothetical protein